MAKYTTLKALFTAIADAIRGQDGSAASIVADDFPDRITSIQTQDYTVEDSIVDGSITEYTNDRVVRVGSTFYHSNDLIKVDFPKVTYIGNYGFYQCNNLMYVNMPKLLSIGTDAFVECISIRELKFPMLINIGNGAFEGCKRLSVVEMCGWNKDLVPSGNISSDAFLNSGISCLMIRSTEGICELSQGDAFDNTPIANGTGYIYVPRALIEDYKVAENWSTYASQFRALEDYTVDGTVTGELDESKI